MGNGAKLRKFDTSKTLTPFELELLNWNFWAIEQALNSVGASTPASIIPPSAGITDHHLLSNLTAFDDHPQYLYLNSRSGGQTIGPAINNSDNTISIKAKSGQIGNLLRLLTSADEPIVQFSAAGDMRLLTPTGLLSVLFNTTGITQTDVLTGSFTITADAILILRGSTSGPTIRLDVTTGLITINDSELRIQDNADNTKKLAFECSSIATGTTRTWTAQNANGTVAFLSDIPSVPTFPIDNTNITNRTRQKDIPLTEFWDAGTAAPITITQQGTFPTAYICVEMANGIDTSLLVQFRLPEDYVSGGTFNLFFTGSGSASNNIVLDAYLRSVTSSEDISAANDASSTTNTLSINGTAGIVSIANISLSTGLVAGDLVRFQFARRGAHASDTYIGVGRFLGASLEYTADM